MKDEFLDNLTAEYKPIINELVQQAAHDTLLLKLELVKETIEEHYRSTEDQKAAYKTFMEAFKYSEYKTPVIQGGYGLLGVTLVSMARAGANDDDSPNLLKEFLLKDGTSIYEESLLEAAAKYQDDVILKDIATAQIERAYKNKGAEAATEVLLIALRHLYDNYSQINNNPLMEFMGEKATNQALQNNANIARDMVKDFIIKYDKIELLETQLSEINAADYVPPLSSTYRDALKEKITGVLTNIVTSFKDKGIDCAEIINEKEILSTNLDKSKSLLGLYKELNEFSKLNEFIGSKLDSRSQSTILLDNFLNIIKDLFDVSKYTTEGKAIKEVKTSFVEKLRAQSIESSSSLGK